MKRFTKILVEEYTCCKQCAYHSMIEFDDVGFGSDDDYCQKMKRTMYNYRDFGNTSVHNKVNETNGFPTWCPLKDGNEK